MWGKWGGLFPPLTSWGHDIGYFINIKVFMMGLILLVKQGYMTEKLPEGEMVKWGLANQGQVTLEPSGRYLGGYLKNSLTGICASRQRGVVEKSFPPCRGPFMWWVPLVK